MSSSGRFRVRLGLLVALATLFAGNMAAVPRAGAAVPTRVLTPRNAIAGSYIVVLKNQAAPNSQVHAKADDLTRAHGGQVKHYYDAALKGYAAAMSPTQAARIASDPAVAYVEQDSIMSVGDTEVGPPSGLDRIDQRQLPLDNSYTYSTTASDVTVYVIDTGIRTTHVDFGGRASVGVDEVGDGQDGQDCNGHGTHVAGTVGGSEYGVAKGVHLVAVRVFDCGGSAPTSQVIAGVNWVTANAVKPAVANMSLGGGLSTAMNTAVQNSIATGITYVVAAGNADADACAFSPASTPNAITVGATNPTTDGRASYSNYGQCLDIFAPGSFITSDWDTSDTATNTISGTSMAAPHVAGVAALYLATHPTASPSAVRTSLVAGATAHEVVDPGMRSPDLLLYSRFADCDRVYGGRIGTLTVSTGVICLNAATVSGAITVARGSMLDLENSTMAGSISANGAESIRICGSSTTGSIAVSGTSGFVAIGNPADDCAPNTVHGGVTAIGNLGGGVINGNTISGAWTIAGNAPPFSQIGNHH